MRARRAGRARRAASTLGTRRSCRTDRAERAIVAVAPISTGHALRALRAGVAISAFGPLRTDRALRTKRALRTGNGRILTVSTPRTSRAYRTERTERALRAVAACRASRTGVTLRAADRADIRPRRAVPHPTIAVDVQPHGARRRTRERRRTLTGDGALDDNTRTCGTLRAFGAGRAHRTIVAVEALRTLRAGCTSRTERAVVTDRTLRTTQTLRALRAGRTGRTLGAVPATRALRTERTLRTYGTGLTICTGRTSGSVVACGALRPIRPRRTRNRRIFARRTLRAFGATDRADVRPGGAVPHPTIAVRVDPQRADLITNERRRTDVRQRTLNRDASTRRTSRTLRTGRTLRALRTGRTRWALRRFNRIREIRRVADRRRSAIFKELGVDDRQVLTLGVQRHLRPRRRLGAFQVGDVGRLPQLEQRLADLDALDAQNDVGWEPVGAGQFHEEPCNLGSSRWNQGHGVEPTSSTLDDQASSPGGYVPGSRADR